MTVLILAAEFDVSADQMILALRSRDMPVCRVDTSWFPTQLSLDSQLSEGRWRGWLRAPGRDIELEGLRSVWYRSPTTFQFAPELSDAERHHAFLEAKYGLGGVLSSLPVLWVNHPARAAAASKPVQLAIAARCGLSVPDTLITNDPAAVRRFTFCGATVTKMLGANHITEEGTRKITFTRLLNDGDLADLRGIDVTTHQFQRWAPKQYDARVIAIGDRLFAFAIHAGNTASHIDFRADYDALSYESIELPTVISEGIRQFLHAMGLVYGALDFVVSPEGAYTFLECNAGGQFGWLEARTGTPLTEALADLLATGAS
ncbi:MAG: ATP-grasp ribosomal peptide maturase [Actinomycetota bacterium]|nr:ATP-grasp ribosomal peptide maturase [Actinomycetota bacterium]